MRDSKLSVIFADSESEVYRLAELLGVEKIMHLSTIADSFHTDDEPVMWAVVDNLAKMRELMDAFNVKRGLMSCDKHIEFSGYNIDWMRKILKSKSMEEKSSKPTPVQIHVDDEERSNPFAEIGYR
jgi:hypothetical protein